MSANRDSDESQRGEDAALVARLRAGDEAAYEQLVREHGAHLLAVTRRLLGNEEDARDALQETFLSAFRAIRAFSGESRLSTWLHRIAVNASLMQLRVHRRRLEHPIDPLLPRFLGTGHHADPPRRWSMASQSLVERGETARLVRASIEQLPQTYRDVVLLRDIEELSTEETARLLGATPNAVKVRLHRARQALRTLLDRQLGSSSA